jgi:hypothetical protein
MSAKLRRAAAAWPSYQLERLLGLVDRRLSHHRARSLALAAVKGAIQTELARRQILCQTNQKLILR